MSTEKTRDGVPIAAEVRAVREALGRVHLGDDGIVTLGQLVEASSLDAAGVETGMSALERTSPVQAVRQGGTGEDITWSVRT